MQQLLQSYARLIRNRSYFPLWLAQLISNLGDTLHYIALVIWVYQRTGSSLVVAGTVFFEVVPVILLAPVAGVIIDRLPRKMVLIASDMVRAVLVLLLLTATELWQIYTIVALLTAAATFFNPAVSATLPTLLDEKDLLAANSVSWSTGRFVQIIGSALAAGLIAAIGAEAAFVFNAATFLISALFLLLLPVPRGRPITARGWSGFVADAREGLHVARTDRFVSRLVVVQALASLSVGATSALLVVLANEHYMLPPGGFGYFILAIGVGALLGPFLLGLLVKDIGHPRWLFGPYIVRGVGGVLMAVTTFVPFAWFLLFIYGLNTSSGMVVYQTWVQRQVPDVVRGRVFTWLDAVWNVMKVISLGIGGYLAQRAGIEAVYYLGGSLLVISGIFGLLTLRDVRLEQTSSHDGCHIVRLCLSKREKCPPPIAFASPPYHGAIYVWRDCGCPNVSRSRQPTSGSNSNCASPTRRSAPMN